LKGLSRALAAQAPGLLGAFSILLAGLNTSYLILLSQRKLRLLITSVTLQFSLNRFDGIDLIISFPDHV
jgi:hypothetical protein